jgi:hypothetical protein
VAGHFLHKIATISLPYRIALSGYTSASQYDPKTGTKVAVPDPNERYVEVKGTYIPGVK